MHMTPEWSASVIGIKIHQNTLSDCVEGLRRGDLLKRILQSMGGRKTGAVKRTDEFEFLG